MKTIFLSSILFSVILLGGCNTTLDNSSSAGSATAVNSDGDAKTILYIEYRENEPLPRPSAYNTINNELDRFHYMERNFEKILGKELSDYTLDFQLFPARVPEGASVLELDFLSFDSPSPIELELRYWAILKKGDEEKDFGIIRSRTVPQQPMTSGSIERDLDAIYSDAASKIAKLLAEEL